MRRKRRAPGGWTIADLVQLSGLTARTIAHYRKLHLVAPPSFRGSHTRYGREHLIRLLFIKRLRRQEDLGLSEIKQRIEALTTADLEALVTSQITTDVLAAALGVPKKVGSSLSAAAPSAAPKALPPQDDGWLRITVSPTLQVLMRRDASPNDLWLIERLQQHCAAAAASTPDGVTAENRVSWLFVRSA